MADLRDAVDAPICQAFGASAAKPQLFVLSYLPHLLPDRFHMSPLFICFVSTKQQSCNLL